MASILSLFFTKTNINGILGRGNMFLFSHNFLQKFLNFPPDWNSSDKRLIDIGAGDGTITLVFQLFFKHVTAVEASKVMEWRLAQHHFKILSVDKWPQSGPYDLICALNLLDRHYAPTQLLKNLHSLALSNGCFLLLSVVLPLNFYVEFNLNGRGTQQDLLLLPFSKTNKNSFEEHAEILVNEVLIPAGFEIVRWTKLPYFSEGDLARAYYKLDDAVFLLKAIKPDKI
uniref:Methyltransferase-like protein 9 n=1 Tax=Meloidogyne incognita TaxID=6306 RepID=A0A914LUJ5_MELIC